MDHAIAEENPRVHIGANQPPIDPIVARTDELAGAANKFAAITIADQDNADAVSALIDQIIKHEKLLTVEKDKEKRPHLDANLEIEKRFKPLVQITETAKALAKGKLKPWLDHLETLRMAALAKQREEEFKALRDAEAARIAAETAAEAAQIGIEADVVGANIAAQDAADRLAEAQATAKTLAAPVQVKSSLGARTKSLRTEKRIAIISYAQALLHYKDRPEVREVIETLARRDARAGVAEIPGVEITEEKVF